MISHQEVFNRSWQAFIVEQKPPSVMRVYSKNGFSHNTCCYLNPITKSKCAIGLCIPDGHRAQKEQDRVNHLFTRYPEIFENSVKLTNIDKLLTLQNRLHDNLVATDGTWTLNLEDRKKEYEKIAHTYNLTVPI